MRLRRWTVVDTRTGKVESRHWMRATAMAQALTEDQIEDARKGKTWPTPRHRKAVPA